MVVFSFFWNASLPQFEAVTMTFLGENTHRYSAIRLWGSFGFILSVASLGVLLERSGPELLPVVLLGLFAAIWLFSLGIPAEGPRTPQPTQKEPLTEVLRRPVVAALLLVCFLMQLSHGPYYTFFSIYLSDHGYSGGMIGMLWALGVIAEIGVFLVMHRLLPRFGVRRLLLASLALTTLRWILLALFVEQLAVIVFAQALHAASFGVYHAVAITLIHALFRGRHQGRGQALYSSISFGAGGAVGSLYAGYLWEGGGATATFLLAALASGVAFILARRLINIDSIVAGRVMGS
jgi:PPP family 3-phenylpropionic acid transporter